MEKKELTPTRQAKRNYEEKNKEKRKQTSATFGTMIPRALFETINRFLKEEEFTKVQLIEAGYKALLEEAMERNPRKYTKLAKLMDDYDDFFEFELEEMKKNKTE